MSDWLTLGGIGLAGLVGGAAWAWSRRPVIGAWTGLNAFRDPDKVGAAAKAAGLQCLDVVLGDQSDGATVSGGLPWSLYGAGSEIVEVLSTLRRYVPSVWATVWAQPRADVVEGVAALGPWLNRARCDGLSFDAEEAWLVPLRRMSAADQVAWSGRLASAARVFRGEVAVTHIVYHDRALDPLLRLVDVLIPQAYATAKNAGTLAPGRLEAVAVERFAPFGKRLVMGAAAWNQEGAYGLDAQSATATSVAAALRLGVREVRFWSLGSLDAADAAAIKAGIAAGKAGA